MSVPIVVLLQGVVDNLSPRDEERPTTDLRWSQGTIHPERYPVGCWTVERSRLVLSSLLVSLTLVLSSSVPSKNFGHYRLKHTVE